MNERTIILASALNFRLKKAGYKVDSVLVGKEVKEYLPHTMLAIIVSDMMRLYFSGIGLINYVRNELLSQIPIIIISSTGNKEKAWSAVELRTNDFFSKPLSPTKLLVRIAKDVNKTQI